VLREKWIRIRTGRLFRGLDHDDLAIPRILGDGAQGSFEGEISSRRDFSLDLRQFSTCRKSKLKRKDEDTGDGAFGRERRENHFGR
jgi:hypothetical protein